MADSYNHEIRNGVPADLKITCTDGKTIVSNGTSDTYTITVTNTGRLPWDSEATPPMLLSYHWLEADGDRFVRFEGEHIVLYQNDRRRYQETADHSRGGGHPILQ